MWCLLLVVWLLQWASLALKGQEKNNNNKALLFDIQMQSNYAPVWAKATGENSQVIT
jgi:hypothetical protein